MQFEDAKLVYQYFETDYEIHNEVASFSNEEAAIQFGVANLMENKGKRLQNQMLLDLEVSMLYDSVDAYVEHSVQFWAEFDDNYKRIMKEIAERYKQQTKKEK